MSVTYDGAEYFYLKNAQGDVTGLVNSAIWNARRYAWDGQDTTPMRLVWKHTRAEADDAFAFLRRMLALGADVQATDRENRSAYSGKTIRQHYEGSPVWELCGDLFG